MTGVNPAAAPNETLLNQTSTINPEVPIPIPPEVVVLFAVCITV